MMRILPIMLWLLLYPLAGVQAQEAIAGFRQGPSLWLTRSGIGPGTVRYAQGQHFTWDKQVFYRQKLKGKWAYEAGLSNYRFNNTGMGRNGRSSERNNILEGNFSVQYDVTYPLLGYMFYSMQGMSAHIGLDVAPALSFNKRITGDDTGLETEQRTTTFSVMVGFTYTHIVPVSRRLNIISKLSFRTNSFSKYQSLAGEVKPNKSIGWHTGLGYTL